MEYRPFVCPKCKSNPRFYYGCRNCGSPQIAITRLIHHFACAHVDSVPNFETPQGTKCPKCLLKGLVVGSDFEFLSGPIECGECGWKDISREVVGFCEGCKLRFPINLCEEQVRNVERLDPLAHQQTL